MEMTEIPKISITQDFVTDDHEDDDDLDDNDERADIYEAHTDIENLDSDEDTGLSSNKLLKTRKRIKSKRIENCHTDVESCQDSGSDDAHSDRSRTIDTELSFNEFLDMGFTEETSSFGGEHKIRQSQRGKRASLLVPKEDDGAITDCENLENTSDEEWGTASTVCIGIDEQKFNNFLLENDDYSTGNVNNSSSLKNRSRRDRISSGKNVEISYSECDLPPNSWNEHSDMECFALSDQECKHSCAKTSFTASASAFDFEEMIVAVSDVEDSCPNTPQQTNPPEIVIAFVGNRTKKPRMSARARNTKVAQGQNMLNVVQCPDDAEALTDLEVLDSSDDEKENIRKKLTIPIAYVSSSSLPLTDVECFDVDDSDLAGPSTSCDIKLPSPVREICVMREDEHGDPVAKVMPLIAPDNGQFLSIAENYVDKGLTDTELMSGGEEEYGNDNNKYDLAEVPDIDSGTVTSTEALVTFVREKKAENDPLTDIEELQMAQQTRRKKTKPKTSKTKDGLLAVHNDEDAAVLTENDEVLMEEHQAAHYFSRHIQKVAGDVETSNERGPLTDTESLSGDEETIFGQPLKDIDSNMLRQETFFSTITLTDCSPIKPPGRYSEYSRISTIVKTREAHDSSAEMSVTSVEELAHSDSEDMLGVDLEMRNQSITPNELRTTFNETISSRIHDQSRSQFDRTNEVSQMKNFAELQDTHTDVECLDDDKF